MVNNSRAIPIQKIDYLSLVATVLGLIGTSYELLKSSDVLGNFEATGEGALGTLLADQPVQTLDIGSGVTSATVIFTADYSFQGIKVNGSAATISDSGLALNAVKNDAVTLYKAVYADSAVTITAITP